MKTSARFGGKNFKFFEIHGVFARPRGEGLSQCVQFCGQEWRCQFFAILCGMFFMDGPIALC